MVPERMYFLVTSLTFIWPISRARGPENILAHNLPPRSNYSIVHQEEKPIKDPGLT